MRRSGNHPATNRSNSTSNSGRVRWSLVGRRHLRFLPAHPLALFLLFLLAFVAFLPLVRPWRLRYRRKAMGRANTLVGAHQGKRISNATTPHSHPQGDTL